MISNWKTTYTSDNENMAENLNNISYKKSTIPAWFKHDYHTYHRTNYQGESIKSYGVHGDKPIDKFFDRSQGLEKLYSDNYNLSAGTTKNTVFIPGYSGKLFILYCRIYTY